VKKEIRAWLILLAWVLIGTSPVIYAATTQQPAEEAYNEHTEDIIRWKQEDTEVSVEPLDIEIVEQPAMESLGMFKLTAYCPCKNCTSDGDGITASGTVATQGRTIAVDPSIIPYGTVLIINEHEYIAEDSGGKWIQGKEIDIFFDSHQEALEFGVQYAEVCAYENLQNLAE
jgi:3D (Asp-Asp-Asp) domain-containing protein